MRARAHRLGAVVTVVAALLVVASPSAAQQPDDPPGGGEEARTTSAIELISQTTWVRADGQVALRLDVGDADPDDRLRVTVHDRLGGRNDFFESLDGERLGGPLRTIVDGTIAELDPDGDDRIDASVGLRPGAGDLERLLIRRDGLHPVEVELTSADGERTGGFVTHIARLPEDLEGVEHELGLAVVQSLGAPPSIDASGAIDIDPDALAHLSGAVTALDGDSRVPITFRLTPETIVALDGSGLELNDELLEGLASVLRDGTIASSTFVELDVGNLARAGLGEIVAEQLGLGAWVADEYLGTTMDTSTWVADAGLGSVGLDELTRHGVAQLIVPRTSLVGEQPELLLQPFHVRSRGGTTVTALATDPSLQAHAGSTDSAVLDAQHLLADLASMWFERPAYARGTALELPAATSDHTIFVETLLEGLETSPIIDPGTVDEVIENADPAAAGGIDATVDEPGDRLVLELSERTTAEEVSSLSAYRSDRQRTLGEVDSFASVFVDSPKVFGYRMRMGTSVSEEIGIDERRQYLALIRDDIEAHLSNLGMPDHGAITLPSRDGVIPLTLVNNTGLPATLAIELDSDKLEFPEGNRIEITLTEAHTPIEIPVRARASGAFPLDMSLETPDGRVQLVDSRYTVRSTAVSGLGIALSVTAVLVLVAWWLRTARRARAEHRTRLATSSTEHGDTSQ